MAVPALKEQLHEARNPSHREGMLENLSTFFNWEVVCFGQSFDDYSAGCRCNSSRTKESNLQSRGTSFKPCSCDETTTAEEEDTGLVSSV